jgi:DnaJ-class molecular chaperone
MARVVVTGKGNDGMKGGPNGDLIVEINPLPDEERGMEAFMSPDGFPFLRITRKVHPEDFVLGTAIDIDVYGRLLVVDVPPGTSDFAYDYPVENLFGTGLKAMVNVELASEEGGEAVKSAYSALRDARKAEKT